MAGTTRKSLNLRGSTYNLLKDKADADGKTVSGLLEELIDAKMDELGVPPETELTPREFPPRVTTTGRFTF